MASLVVVEGAEAGRDIPLGRAVILGRQKGVDVLVDDIAASREHAKVFHQDGDWFVLDLNSRNGTKVNGEKISRHNLAHGDTIAIGKTVIRFVAPELASKAPGKPLPATAGAASAPAAAPAAGPKGPSALERERERLRTAAASRPAPSARAAADDGSGVVIREKVLQYGRIDDRGGLLRDDLGQRGGLFKAGLALVFLGALAVAVWGIVKLLEKEPVDEPEPLPAETRAK
jgi:hypothetical protein